MGEHIHNGIENIKLYSEHMEDEWSTETYSLRLSLFYDAEGHFAYVFLFVVKISLNRGIECK